MVGRTKPATKSEKAHLDAVKRIGCLACIKLGMPMQCGPTEAHHTLSGGRRRGHAFVIPLGQWHHRAVTWHSFNAHQMTETFGPSLAKGSKPFHEAFGSDNELLAEVERLMNTQERES